LTTKQRRKKAFVRRGIVGGAIALDREALER
jgi:hypothetical protein